MKIYLGADHRGFSLKEELKPWVIQQGYEVVDVGAASLTPGDDYMEYAQRVVDSISAEESRDSRQHGARGILVCGSGVGMDIFANRFKGIRCGFALSVEQVRAARHEDDVNVLALAAEHISVDQTKEMVKTFLETEFSGEERYKRRLLKLESVFPQS